LSVVEPWTTPTGRKIWKSKAQFMAYIRGGIRLGLWNRSPIKLQFLNDNRKKVPLGRKTIPNPKGMIWGGECCQCKKDFKISDINVDHKVGNHKLQDVDDLQNFITAIVFVNPETDLQLICKGCHTIKSYSERMGISFKEASIEKSIIAIIKEGDREWLKGRVSEVGSNAKIRRQQITEIVRSEY